MEIRGPSARLDSIVTLICERNMSWKHVDVSPRLSQFLHSGMLFTLYQKIIKNDFYNVKSSFKYVLWNSRWVNPMTGHSNLYYDNKMLSHVLTGLLHIKVFDKQNHGKRSNHMLQSLNLFCRNVNKTTSKTNKALRRKAESFAKHGK